MSLREIGPVRQVPGEPRRRWFSSPDLDLVVWLGDDGRPMGFHLSYDKRGRERALVWTAPDRYQHTGIDSGEQHALRFKQTPIHAPDGVFDSAMVGSLFRRASLEVPRELADLVLDRIEKSGSGVFLTRPPIEIRRFRPGDEAALLEIHRAAIHRTASADYSPEQLAAWAPAVIDAQKWRERVTALDPFVAEIEGRIVGYADLQSDGLIDHFFVSPDHPRRGVGSALMQRLFEEAAAKGIGELYSFVSRTAEPFYARHGFEVVERRENVIRGVSVPNALMRGKIGKS